MSVKDDVAAALESSCGEYVSGQELAQRLGCTRGAVWKAVRALQQQGYEISASTNKGYCLETDCDVISENGIKKYLDPELVKSIKIELFECVDSTNNVARQYAVKGADEGTVVIALEQNGGKGRLGRSFFSPLGTGLYMSIILRPKLQIGQAVRITTCAALAVCEAIERATGEKTFIKWVNDVYLRGAKVCGILTEASLSMENGGIDYAVLGIGVNVYEPQGGFPKQLNGVAGAVAKERKSELKNKLAGGIISSFMRYYSDIEKGGFRDDYSRRLIWKGEDIFIITKQGKIPCTIVDVDDDCKLLVTLENGEQRLISSGEISIRKR